MIKLLGDESVGADGKLILGGVREEKKKKPAATFILCVSITPKGGLIGWNIYRWKTKVHPGYMKGEPEALFDPY